MLPSVTVWLRKVDFEVDPNANNRNAFVCHIAVAYSKDLYDKLQGMDAKGYFSSVVSLEKTYKDSIEIFKYDMIPGRNKLNQSINLKSYTKAKGAFLFAKYLTPGKFMENVGSARSLVVRFLPYKMEVHSDTNLDALTQKLNLG
ncbi:MAG: hypothetical protein LBU51_00780 [Bacteroidales bacterium]|jgi:hypothetical protein|nr:hypothetical protein [Bacteroidales bacterium]